MKFRRKWAKYLETWGPTLAVLALTKQQWSPWVSDVFTQPKERFLHALGLAVGTASATLALIHSRKLLPQVRGLLARRPRRRAPTVKNTPITPGTGSIELTGQVPKVVIDPPPTAIAGTISAPLDDVSAVFLPLDPSEPPMGTRSNGLMADMQPHVFPTRINQDIVNSHWGHYSPALAAMEAMTYPTRFRGAVAADHPYYYALTAGIPPWSAKSAYYMSQPAARGFDTL